MAAVNSLAATRSGFLPLHKCRPIERIESGENNDRNLQSVAQFRRSDGAALTNDDIDISEVPILRRAYRFHQFVKVIHVSRLQQIGIQPFDPEDPAELPWKITILGLVRME